MPCNSTGIGRTFATIATERQPQSGEDYRRFQSRLRAK